MSEGDGGDTQHKDAPKLTRVDEYATLIHNYMWEGDGNDVLRRDPPKQGQDRPSSCVDDYATHMPERDGADIPRRNTPKLRRSYCVDDKSADSIVYNPKVAEAIAGTDDGRLIRLLHVVDKDVAEDQLFMEEIKFAASALIASEDGASGDICACCNLCPC
jgi:hypothetical protein